MTKSGLSVETAAQLRGAAALLLPSYTSPTGEIDKAGIQAAVERMLFAEGDYEQVAAVLGAGKADWLFEGARFAIYEMLRHKIRNQRQVVATPAGQPLDDARPIRRIRQVPAGPVTRIAKLTLELTPLETQRVVEEYDQAIQRLQREQRQFRRGLKKMKADSQRYPTLGRAWNVAPVAAPARKPRRARQTP